MNQRVLITGATRGIGREVALQLSKQGATLFISGRDESLLEELTQSLGCMGCTADLTDTDQTIALYEKARTSLGEIDVLINNAGINHIKAPIPEIELSDWERQYEVNLRAPMLLCREALKDMAVRRSGHIINVISSIAKTSQPGYAIYCTMKHALKGFTQCLIKEALEVNVKVSAVYPGGTDTDFRPEQRLDYMRPESAAAMILYCLTAPDDVVVHDLTYRPMVERNF